MTKLFDKFPRQIMNRKIVKTEAEFREMVKRFHKISTVFTSVYNLDYVMEENERRIDYSETIIDKIFNDIDGLDKLWVAVKMHNWCVKKNYKHTIIFSGGGFHVYVLAAGQKESLSQNEKRNLLRNVHESLAKEIGLSWDTDLDSHIRGDIGRMARVPGTFNHKRGKWCIGINAEDLEKGIDHILEKAEEKSTKLYYYGENELDLAKFDVKVIDTEFKKLVLSDEQKKYFESNKMLKNLPPCVKCWLSFPQDGKKIGWKRRGWLFMWLRDYGIWREAIDEPMPCMLEESIEIVKKYMSESEFIHSCTGLVAPGYNERGENQPQYLYKPYVRTRNSFPSCKTIKNDGDCPVSGLCKERRRFGSGLNGL